MTIDDQLIAHRSNEAIQPTCILNNNPTDTCEASSVVVASSAPATSLSLRHGSALAADEMLVSDSERFTRLESPGLEHEQRRRPRGERDPLPSSMWYACNNHIYHLVHNSCINLQ